MTSVLVKQQIRPRPVFCITCHAYRDCSVAEAVCSGHFTHAGVTISLGTEPDWLTSPFPPDAEWRIELSKFYYGLDLAFAFSETGAQKFLSAWERLVRSWIEQVPIDFDPSDVVGRRILNWIYAWNEFAAAPGFIGISDGLDDQIISSIAEHVLYLRHHLSVARNHRTLELYALFIAALALPEIDKDGSLLDLSIIELHRNLLSDVRSDGVHCESSTHYHMVALRSFLAARENARLFGITFPDGYDEHLERACEFAMHCHRPDGSVPALSDSDNGSYLDLLELAASLFARADFLYMATSGKQGAPPEARYVSFPEGGYFIQRSGWDESNINFQDGRFLIFDCGQLGDGGHGHYDALSVEIAAGESPLVVDSGRYTYHESTPNWRHWFKGTAAHNTVCVDGLDQTPYRCGKPKGPTAEARLIERLSAPEFDILCGQVRSPSYEVVHTRFIFFVAGEYWVIVDRLRGERVHDFDLRFHLTPEAMNHTTVFANQENKVVKGPGLGLVFPADHVPQLKMGWVAPKYGTKYAAPVVNVRKTGLEEEFFTLVVPLRFTDPIPSLLVDPNAATCRLISFKVQGVGREHSEIDRVALNADPQRFAFASYSGSARATWMRASAGGEASVFRACDARTGSPSEEKERPNADARMFRWIGWDESTGQTHDEGSQL